MRTHKFVNWLIVLGLGLSAWLAGSSAPIQAAATLPQPELKSAAQVGAQMPLAAPTLAGDIAWTEKAPMPVPVASFGYAVLGDKIYVVGGESAGASMNTLQRYTPSTNKWETDTGHGGTLAPLPQPRSFGFVCQVLSGRIHCMGGWQNGAYRGDHFIYDPTSNAWSTGPALPGYPIGQFAATVNNKIYVFGGWWGSYWNTVYEYSEAAGWSSKAAMPTARNHGTTAVYNGKIYVIGGESGQPAQQQPVDVVEMYDPATDTWTTGLAHLPSPRNYIGWSGTPTIDDMIYVVAGTTAYAYDPAANAWQTLNSLPVAGGWPVAVDGILYSIGPDHTVQGIPASRQATIDWIVKTPMPVAVSNFGYAALADKIYFVGGRDLQARDTTAVQRYTPATDSWEVDSGHGGHLAPLPAPREFNFCGAIGGKIHCMGGWQDGEYRGEHYIYDPASNTWSAGPSLPQYPIGQFSATVNDKIYVFGGWWGNFRNTVFEYSEAGGWVSKRAMPTARNHGTAAVYDGKIYVMGGMNGPTAQTQRPLDVVEVYDPKLDTWTTGLPRMPVPLGYLGASGAPVSGGIIYMLAPNATPFGYNPVTNSWTTFNSMPGPAWGVTAINSSLYAFGPEHTIQGAPMPWAMFHHDPQHTGKSPYVGPQQNTVAWTYDVGSEINSSPAVGTGGTIYIGLENRKLYAIAPDGSVLWAFPTGGGIYSSPALANDGTIYVGSRDYKLYAIKPDGTLSWTYTTGGEVNSSPTVGDDGTIYVGSNDGKLYVISPTGRLKCSYPAGAVVQSSPVIGPDGILYFGSANGRMNAIYPDCTLRWSQRVTTNGVWTHPALSPDGTTVYYSTDDGYLYATYTLSGALKWKSPWTYGGIQSSPAVGSDGTIYVGTQWGSLWALDPTDGSLKWDHYMTLSAWSSPAIGADGVIYFATDYGYVYAMNPDGTVKWTFPGGYGAAGHFRSSPAIGSNGALYIASNNGKLFAFGTLPSACGPQIGSWQQATALPRPSGTTGARGQQTIVYNGRVYVFGGINDTDSQMTNVYYSTINADGSLGPWIETTSLPGRYFDQVVVRVGRHVYLVTGADGAIAVYYAPINPDGAIGAWVRTADLLPSRQEFAAAAYGEYLYVVAGNASGLSKLVKFASVKPDGSLNPWADTTPLLEAMQAHTMVAHDRRLYVFAPNSTVYSAVIQADGRVGSWGTTTSLPQAMSNYTTFEHLDRVYLLGGSSQSVYYAPLQTDSSLGPWQTTTALPAQRNRLRAGGHNCYVYAIGGYDGSHFRDTVYYARLQPVCEPVASVRLSRTPDGELFTGNAVRFTADANGTRPFTYAWTLNGAPVGGNLSTFDYTFSAAGTYAVGVTVTNGCSHSSANMTVEIHPRDQRPDLSPSAKSVNLANVETGDILTYTLFLRNTSTVVATAVLTDAIPAHTEYVPNSARASGGTVIATGGTVLWSGQIISGTPVMIEFAVQALTAASGTPITNVAYLNDGSGRVLPLSARSTYNPGLGLMINGGALFTSIPTVTLSLSWGATNPPIERMYISNDGGFGSGTGWIPVADTRTGWVLATYGNLVMPRTVYAKFRAGDGQQYGPVQDEIIYDPVPPIVIRVDAIAQMAHGLQSAGGRPVIVQVTSSDDNSGVSRVQISSDDTFAQFSEFTAAGNTTDIPWTLESPGMVYVRVVDRAGNLSQAGSNHGQVQYRVHLPVVMGAWH